MLTGRLFVDDRDAYATFGVYVLQGGWCELVAFPPLKDVPTNDWQEDNGIEVDLHAPKLNTREVQLHLGISGDSNRYKAFIAHLSSGIYHTFRSDYIGRTYNLRLTAVSSLARVDGLTTLTLKLADDFPLQGYVYRSPQSSILATNRTCALDGRPLSDYGLQIISGTYDDMAKPAAIKGDRQHYGTPLVGSHYASRPVAYKAKDAKLYCLIRAPTLAELWRNCDALLYDLTRPYARKLHIAALDQTLTAYYKSCAVQEFYPEGQPWLKLTLTLTITQ